jgi:hypothetical protein
MTICDVNDEARMSNDEANLERLNDEKGGQFVQFAVSGFVI